MARDRHWPGPRTRAPAGRVSSEGMVMMRRLAPLILATGGLWLAGCNKPTEDNCRKAISNVQSLYGTDPLKTGDFESQVRLCRGGSSREAVDCAIRARTVDDLKSCKGFARTAAQSTE